MKASVELVFLAAFFTTARTPFQLQSIISELLTFRELYCRTNKVFKDKSGFSPANIFRYGVEPTELYFRILYPFL